MIKVKDLRVMAHQYDLKYAVTSYDAADRLAKEAVELACRRAKQDKSPKLEGRHFKGISVLSSDSTDGLKRILGLKTKRSK